MFSAPRIGEELQAYARVTGGELKLAVFWDRWSLWTVVSPNEFVDQNGDLTLDMIDSGQGKRIRCV